MLKSGEGTVLSRSAILAGLDSPRLSETPLTHHHGDDQAIAGDDRRRRAPEMARKGRPRVPPQAGMDQCRRERYCEDRN